MLREHYTITLELCATTSLSNNCPPVRQRSVLHFLWKLVQRPTAGRTAVVTPEIVFNDWRLVQKRSIIGHCTRVYVSGASTAECDIYNICTAPQLCTCFVVSRASTPGQCFSTALRLAGPTFIPCLSKGKGSCLRVELVPGLVLGR